MIAIIGVLVALLLPAVQAAREAARRSDCVNRLRQQSVAAQSFYSQQNRFPEGGRIHTQSNQPGVSWRVLLLPHLEEETLFDRIGPTPNGGAKDWDPQADMPGTYACPSADGAASGQLVYSNYWGVAGAARAEDGLDLEDFVCGDLDSNGVLFPGSKTRIAQIEDGTSHTLTIGEGFYSFRAWMTGATAVKTPTGEFRQVCVEAGRQIRYPLNADHGRWGYFVGDDPVPPGAQTTMLLNNLPFGSYHPGGANFAFADASVHFLPDDIDFTVYESLATIAGGEVSRWPE